MADFKVFYLCPSSPIRGKFMYFCFSVKETLFTIISRICDNFITIIKKIYRNTENKMTNKIHSTKLSNFWVSPNHNARKIFFFFFRKYNFNELQDSQNVTKSTFLFCLQSDRVFIVHLLEEQRISLFFYALSLYLQKFIKN